MTVSAATRVRWIELQGKKALFMDFADSDIADSLAMIREFDAQMRGQEPGSVLMLTDVTGSVYDPSIARQWKEARNRHDAAIRKSAIYGLQGLVGLAIRGFIEARRFLGFSDDYAPRVFGDGEEARAWLAEQ